MEEYPDGKLSKDDDGELKMMAFMKNGRLILDFGKDVSWLGFGKKELEVFIKQLTEKLGEM